MESRLDIALIYNRNLLIIEIIRSAGIGPLYIIRLIALLSYLNLTLLAQASKNATTVLNGPPIPSKGPSLYPPSRFRIIVLIFRSYIEVI